MSRRGRELRDEHSDQAREHAHAVEDQVGRLLSADSWQALLQIGKQTNQRLLDAQLQAFHCAPDPIALHAIVLPAIVLPSLHDGLPAPAYGSATRA